MNETGSGSEVHASMNLTPTDMNAEDVLSMSQRNSDLEHDSQKLDRTEKSVI